jgi:hypothetical protein
MKRSPNNRAMGTQTPSMFTELVAGAKTCLKECTSRLTIINRCTAVTYTVTSRHAEGERECEQSAAAKYQQYSVVNTSVNISQYNTHVRNFI